MIEKCATCAHPVGRHDCKTSYPAQWRCTVDGCECRGPVRATPCPLCQESPICGKRVRKGEKILEVCKDCYEMIQEESRGS